MSLIPKMIAVRTAGPEAVGVKSLSPYSRFIGGARPILFFQAPVEPSGLIWLFSRFDESYPFAGFAL
jgi:hypothetical protein